METTTVGWARTISAVFLVAGTCIGGGMLALPVATGLSGFFPSSLMMLLCWVMMTLTGLLLVEASLWLRDGAHMITMSEEMLGWWGKAVSWVVYLFIGYGSIVAYTAVGGMEIVHVLEFWTGWTVSKAVGCVLFLALFGVIVDFGGLVVGRINSILFVGMIVAYFCVLGWGVQEVQPELLAYQRWNTAFLGIPLLLTSFSYQSIVPSLTPYLKRNIKALRFAVIGGSVLTLLIYIVWQTVILGILPIDGPNSLNEALVKGAPASIYLRKVVNSAVLSYAINFFAFFAIVTSFLGISFGLYDFLSDGLKIPKKGVGKIALGALLVIPTLILAIFFERIFLVALDATGGFGDSILSGALPVFMVWSGRYIQKRKGQFRVPGGKVLLVLILIFFSFSLGVELFSHLGWISSVYDVSDVNVL